MSFIISNSSFLLRIVQGCLAGFVIALVATPAIQRVALRIGCVSYPKQDRWHSQPRPLLGGMAIFTAFIIPFSIFCRESGAFWPLLAGSVFSVGLGLLDDLRHIKPSTKLIGQIIIACLMVFSGLKFTLEAGPPVSVPLTIFWIVGMMNALNLLDNMDGLAGGVAVISALALCGNTLMNGHPQTAVLMSILVGATLAFLRYNFPPAKIFMGDSGSLLLGYLLSVGAILRADGGISGMVMTLAVPVLILSVPIFDTTFVTLVRKLNRRPISRGGRDHTSHRLVAFGLSERKAILTLYTVSLLFGSLAIFYTQGNPVTMAVMFGLAGIALFAFGRFLGEIKVYTDEEKLTADEGKNGWVFLNGMVLHKRRIVEVLLDFVIICLSYVAAFLLRFEGVISPKNLQLIFESLPILIVVKFIVFFYFGLYRGVWRYASLNDLAAIFKGVVVGQVASMLALLFLFRFEGYSRTVFVIDGLLSLVLVGGSRMLLALFRDFFISISERSKRILIMGAGDAGEFALREIKNNHRLSYKPVGFIDDDAKKQGYRIHGIPVLGTRRELVDIAKQEEVKEVLIAIPSVPDPLFKDVYESCRENDILCHRMSYVIDIHHDGGDGSNGGKK